MSADLGGKERGFPKAPEPFGLTSHRGSYTPREATENALAQLLACVREARPVTVVSGPPGLGKTLLLHVLAHRLDAEVHPVYLPYGALTPEDLCFITLNQLGSPSIEDPVGMLKVYARHLQEEGSALLLLIDDAGAIPGASLRWCAEFAGSSGGAVRCVFAVTDDAHSGEVIATLGSDVAEVRLATPMTRMEADDYVEVQLAVGRASGAVRALFDGETVARLFEASGGVPRRLHIAAQAVLRQEPKAPPPAEPRIDELEIDDDIPDDSATAPVAPAIREEIERMRRDTLRARIAEEPEAPPPAAAAPAISQRSALMAGLFAAAVVAGVGIAFAVKPLATWVFPASPPVVVSLPVAPATTPSPVAAQVAEPPARTAAPTEAPEVRAPSPQAAAESQPSAPSPVAAVVPESPAPSPVSVSVPEGPTASPVMDPVPEAPAPSPPVQETVPEPSVASRLGETRPRVEPQAPPVAEPRVPVIPAEPVPAPPVTVAVNINAIPWATIDVDGETLGETPLAGVPLPAGPHTFRARLPDGQVLERVVEIDADNRFVVFEAAPAEARAAP